MSKKYYSKSRRNIQKISVIVVALVIVAAGIILWTRDHKSSKGAGEPLAPTNHQSGNANTKGEGPVQSLSANSVPPSQSNTGKLPSTGNTAPQLIQPTGTFVSDHNVNISDTSYMASSCNTTSGAKCQIVFTNGDTVRSLPAETTDNGGSAYWNWTIQQIGLTAGTWQVKAVATLNGQSSTAYDALQLKVSR